MLSVVLLCLPFILVQAQYNGLTTRPPYTPPVYTPTRTVYTPPPYTPTRTVYTPPPTVYTPTRTVYTPPPTVYTPTRTVYTPPPTVYTPTRTVYTPPPTVYTPTRTVYTPPPTVYTLTPTAYTISPPYTTRPGYVATNPQVQAAVASSALVSSTLASATSDPIYKKFLTDLAAALRSIQRKTFDQPSLVQLSPFVSAMEQETDAAALQCTKQQLPSRNLNNLQGNLVWWSNGGNNPTTQQVQNLIRTTTQFLQQYC